jgi:uncharacterized protein YndB with AHSA1/START domain
MARVEDSVDIRAPIEIVFAAVTDPRRSLDWNPTLVDVSNMTGLPPAVGTSWRQIANYVGRRVTLDCRIAEYNPPHEGVLDISGDYAGRIVTLCESVQGATRLVQTIEFEPPGGIAGRLAMAVIQPVIKREIDRTLTRQREILEREAGTSDGSETS